MTPVTAAESRYPKEDREKALAIFAEENTNYANLTTENFSWEVWAEHGLLVTKKMCKKRALFYKTLSSLFFFHSGSSSAALKLYTGFIISTISTDSSIPSMISSNDLYAIGASSIVCSLTEVL